MGYPNERPHTPKAIQQMWEQPSPLDGMQFDRALALEMHMRTPEEWRTFSVAGIDANVAQSMIERATVADIMAKGEVSSEHSIYNFALPEERNE